jgi:hypothetical protein
VLGILLAWLTGTRGAHAEPAMVFPGSAWQLKTPQESGLDGDKLNALADAIGGDGVLIRNGISSRRGDGPIAAPIGRHRPNRLSVRCCCLPFTKANSIRLTMPCNPGCNGGGRGRICRRKIARCRSAIWPT